MDGVIEERIINNVGEFELKAQLRRLLSDSTYLTEPTIRNGQKISFVEHHIGYLIAHPLIQPQDYIANLRLRLRK